MGKENGELDVISSDWMDSINMFQIALKNVVKDICYDQGSKQLHIKIKCSFFILFLLS